MLGNIKKKYVDPEPSQAKYITLSPSQAKPARLQLFGGSQLGTLWAKLKPIGFCPRFEKGQAQLIFGAAF